jgi:glutamate synthase domain-containing protein 1
LHRGGLDGGAGGGDGAGIVENLDDYFIGFTVYGYAEFFHDKWEQEMVSGCL